MMKQPIQPPRWADKILETLFHGEALEEVQGDLHESFLWRLEEEGQRYAQWHFIKEIIQSIRFSNLKPYPFMDQLFTLFRSYIKTGWRFLWKTKGYSAINIIGLSIGIVFSWFAYQYAADQYGYNKHIKHIDNLYKMLIQADMMGTKIFFPGGSYKASEMMVDEIPEIEEVALFAEENNLMRWKNQAENQKVLASNLPLMDYLQLEWLEGDVTSFDAPRQTVISETMAYRLGIRGEAIGKNIELQDTAGFTSYEIRAVFRDIPQNTSIRADMMIPLHDFLRKEPERLTSFMNLDLSVLFRFSPNADIAHVNTKINALLKRETEGDNYFANLAPLASFHLDGQPDMGNGFLPGGNKQLIFFILTAGTLCLIISIINYANFSISLYINRTREVAVRKIMGAVKGSVFQQLMTEAFLTTLLATILAFALYLAMAPHFSVLVEKTFDWRTLLDQQFIPGNVGLVAIIAILSGFYPAILLSRLEVIESLKGVRKVGKGKHVMQSLLVLQFAISTAMIVCMFVFRSQLDLLVNRDRGYDVTDVIQLNFPVEKIERQSIKSFKSALAQLAITEGITGYSGLNMHTYDDGSTSFGLLNTRLDSSFLRVMGYRIVEGTHFSNWSPNSNQVIVNQSFLRKVNLNDPIGKTIPFGKSGNEESVIVGVTQDVYNSGKDKGSAVVFFPDLQDRTFVKLYLKTSQDQLAIQKSIEPLWDEFFSPFPLDYDFLEERYNQSLNEEAKIARISGLGSIIAIFIAAFGLMGLVGITIKQKLKRVSISRVLGADLNHIARMISGNFIVPISISLILGLSMSTYFANSWLENYPVRIQLEWYHLLGASFIVLAILLLIIWGQVNTALKKNPIVYLKED